MAKLTSYQELQAWRKAMDLVHEIYQVTRNFPKEEMFGLRLQTRRAAVSVPSNIAEGWSRGSRPDFLRFLDIARGSVYEIQTQVLIAVRLGWIRDSQPLNLLIKDVERLLNALIRSLKTNPASPKITRVK